MSEIITISTIIRAKVEDVFDTYLNPEDNRRWSTAGGGWSVGKVSIDPKVGGKWSIEFKDAAGVHDFEFGGVYTEIIPNQKIVYAMRKEIADIAADDRFGTVTFEADTPIKGNTTVTISFTTEDTNSLEQQRAGWSAILENFKKHTKRKYNPNNAVILKTIEIPVSSKKVWETLWSKQTYPLWTTSFCDGSCYEGELEYDKKVRFMSPDGSGLSSLVKVSIPYFQMSFEHLGSIVAEFEDLDKDRKSVV